MTSPFSAPAERTESLMDWFQLHSKKVGWAALVVAGLAVGGWFYSRSQDLKAERAETAYFTAQRSVVAGNLPLAESDLRKMITRYEGTPAAMQGSLVLAQVMFDQGKIQQGVDELKKSEDAIGKSREFGSAVHLILAGGFEQLRKFPEAASEYEKAAKAARFDSDRQRYMSLAATAYRSAGNKDKAKAIWTELGGDSKGTVAGEARVRLGELEAGVDPKT